MSNEQTKRPKEEQLEIKQKPIFQGTQKRNEMMKSIIQMAREKLPMEYEKFVNILSFQTGLTTRKLKDDYIGVLLSVDILQQNRMILELGNQERGI